MNSARLLLAALAGLLALCPRDALADGCQLIRVVQVPMSIDVTGRINVPMTVGGKMLNMLIDTGGVDSMLTQSSADALTLTPLLLTGGRVTGVGGYHVTHYVRAKDIEFGGLKAETMPFLVQPDGEQMTSDVDGILGPDILRAYDDDFDFAASKFSLFHADHCEGNHVWWTNGPHAEIPFSIDSAGHIMIPVQLDGQTIRAMFDTGASTTLLDLDLAESLFNIDEKDPKLENRPGNTISGLIYRYPFEALSFGGETDNKVTVHNPAINLKKRSDIKLSGLQMLIGINITRRLHIYISYKNRMMYVTDASAH